MKIPYAITLMVLLLTSLASSYVVVDELDEISITNIGQIAKIAEIEIVDTPELADRIVWLPNGAAIVIVTSHQVLLYQVADLDQTPAILFESERRLNRIAFTTDSELMAISSSVDSDERLGEDDPRIQIINLETCEIVADFQIEDPAIALTFGMNNAELIVVHESNYNFSVWDVEQEQLLSLYETGQPGWSWMMDVSFTEDASLVALGSGGTDNTRTVWNTQTGELVAQGEYGYSSQLVFSPDNKILASASRYGGWTQLWHIDTPDEVLTIEYASHYILATDFSADSRLFAQILVPLTMAGSFKIQFVKPDTGQEQYLLVVNEDASIDTSGMDLLFSPDGKWLAIYNANSGIQLWGIESNS